MSRTPKMARIILTFVFLTLAVLAKADESLLTSLEEKLEDKFTKYANNVTEWLESINDKHLGNSSLGKLIHYNEIKPKLDKLNEGRGMKKLSMAMLPIIFHLGATSTWLVLTGLMAVKSVAIGIMLLVFKIAVSSAKVASFFTAWKHKPHYSHEHSWSPPHHDYHGHYRSLHGPGVHELPYHGYNSDWTPDDHSSDYQTIPTNYSPPSYPEVEKSDPKLNPLHKKH